MTKKTKTCPSKCPNCRENATNERLTAFSINSMDMKIVNVFLRSSTPNTPSENRIALTMR